MSDPNEINANLEAAKNLPNFDALDHALTAAKIAWGIIPGVGPVIVELLNKNTTIVIGKRQEKWFQAVIRCLEELYLLDAKKVEKIIEDERFATALLHATQIAMRTHQEEKHETLRNAVINSAAPQALDDNLQLMFLGLIDRFSPWHIKILKLLSDQKKLFEIIGISNNPTPGPRYFERIVEAAFPELQGQSEYYTQVAKDLSDCGLAQPNMVFIKREYKPDFSHWWNSINNETLVTKLGRQFLTFIMSPLSEQKESDLAEPHKEA